MSKQILSKEFKRMQKLAGISLNENQYYVNDKITSKGLNPYDDFGLHQIDNFTNKTDMFMYLMKMKDHAEGNINDPSFEQKYADYPPEDYIMYFDTIKDMIDTRAQEYPEEYQKALSKYK